MRAFDQEVADEIGVLTEPFVHFDADDDLVVAPAQAGGFESAEGAEEGASDLGGVEPGPRGAVFVEAEAVFGFAAREVVAGVDQTGDLGEPLLDVGRGGLEGGEVNAADFDIQRAPDGRSAFLFFGDAGDQFGECSQHVAQVALDN